MLYNNQERNKKINLINKNNYINKMNNTLINKSIYNNDKIINLITDLSVEKIKQIIFNFCCIYKYKISDSNDYKYTIFINDTNSFILEIIFRINDRMIKIYHNFGSEIITKEIMDKIANEINNKIY